MPDVLCPAKSFIVVVQIPRVHTARAGLGCCNLITRYLNRMHTPHFFVHCPLVDGRLTGIPMRFSRDVRVERVVTLITSHTTRTWVHLRQPGSKAVHHSTPQEWKQTHPINRIERVTTFFALLGRLSGLSVFPLSSE